MNTQDKRWPLTLLVLSTAHDECEVIGLSRDLNPTRHGVEDYWDMEPPGYGFWIWEGHRYDVDLLTEEEIQTMGVDTDCDEWYYGEWRAATVEDLRQHKLLVEE